jgi:hypothetical protein
VPTPITDLEELIRCMQPELMSAEYVFLQVDRDDEKRVLAAKPLATFWESEGLSAIIERSSADRLHLSYDSVHRCIVLRVESSLSAVGLTATVSRALADASLSANVVAAHSHDYVFVPTARAVEALGVLREISGGA